MVAAVAKGYPLYRRIKFADEECHIISAVSRIMKTFVHKEIRQPDEAQTFRRLAHVKSHRLPTQAKSTQVEWRPLIYY